MFSLLLIANKDCCFGDISTLFKLRTAQLKYDSLSSIPIKRRKNYWEALQRLPMDMPLTEEVL